MASLTIHQVTSCLLEVVDELPANYGLPLDKATDYMLKLGYHPMFMGGAVNTLVNAKLAIVRHNAIYPERS